MPIFNRVRRLFQADLHAILDSLEEPQTLLKQALREMEEALDKKSKHLALRQRQQQAVEASASRLQERHSQLEGDLRLALGSSTEEICRKIIGRKLALQKQLGTLQEQLKTIVQNVETLTLEIQQQQQEYESIRERADHLIVPPPDDSPESLAESILTPTASTGRRDSFGISDEEIELEWIRLRQPQGGES